MSSLSLRKRHERLDHARPTLCVARSVRNRLELAMRHLHVRAIDSRRQLPAHQRRMLRERMKICAPRVGKRPRRIKFHDLALDLEFGDAVDLHLARRIIGDMPHAAAESRLELPDLDTTWPALSVPPAHQQVAGSQGLKNFFRRSGNLHFADHRILVGSYDCLGHHGRHMSTSSLLDSLLGPLVRETFLHLFSVIDEDPFFRVVIRVRLREGRMLHVSIAWSDVGSVEELEADRLRVRGHDFHARLIAGAAVVGHHQAVSVHVEHGDHVLRTFAVNLAHERGAVRSHAERDFQWLTLRVLPYPVPFHPFQHVERLVGVRLGEGKAGAQHGNGNRGGSDGLSKHLHTFLLKFIFSSPGSYPPRGRTRFPQKSSNWPDSSARSGDSVRAMNRPLSKVRDSVDKGDGVRDDVLPPGAPSATGADAWKSPDET